MSDRQTPFGVNLDDLTIELLKSNLPPGEYEPLTWEGKGTKTTKESIRRQVCAFANSRSGGLLLLGTTQDKRTGAWGFDGVDLGPEPIASLDQIIRDGLSPVPQFWPRVLGKGAQGHVIGVLVRSLPDPPCITVDGQVFDRVPGRTIPVATSADLARLYERGETARARAEDAAARVIARGIARAPETDWRALYVVAMAATGLPDDVPATIYTKSFVDSLEPLLIQAATSPRPYVRPHSAFQNRAVVGWVMDFHQVEGPFFLVTEDGAIAVGFSDPDHTDGEILLTSSGHLERAWAACLEIARRMDCYGSAVVAVLTSSRHGEVQSTTWTEIADDIERDDLESMLRDLRRTQGDAAFEPEG